MLSRTPRPRFHAFLLIGRYYRPAGQWHQPGVSVSYHLRFRTPNDTASLLGRKTGQTPVHLGEKTILPLCCFILLWPWCPLIGRMNEARHFRFTIKLGFGRLLEFDDLVRNFWLLLQLVPTAQAQHAEPRKPFNLVTTFGGFVHIALSESSIHRPGSASPFGRWRLEHGNQTSDGIHVSVSQNNDFAWIL